MSTHAIFHRGADVRGGGGGGGNVRLPVRVADCHAGVLGSNPGGPRYFPLGITSLVAAVIRERLSWPLGA